MPSYKLTYFNLRARAEVPRLIMAYGDIEYEDVRVTSEQWAAIKESTPFGQLPMLEVDGEAFCQGEAIGRYLAKQTSLYGKNDMDALKIDMILGCLADVNMSLVPIFKEKDEEKKTELKQKYEEAVASGLKRLEALLKGDYFLSSGMSMADIAFAESVLLPTVVGVKVPLDKCPKLSALKGRVESHPKIAAWIAKRPESSF